MAELSDDDRAILEFEDQRWKYAGAKEAAIRERFKLSSTRYAQRLNHIIHQPAAEAAMPQLVRRLRRLREQRKQFREQLRREFDI